MRNVKHLLMDFYLALLALPANDSFRSLNTSLYAEVRNTLAAQLGESAETVQNIFERMVAEDSDISKSNYCVRCNQREARISKLCYQCVGR